MTINDQIVLLEQSERAAVLAPVAQRGSADLRDRIPPEAIILTGIGNARMQECTECTCASHGAFRIFAFVHFLSSSLRRAGSGG